MNFFTKLFGKKAAAPEQGEVPSQLTAAVDEFFALTTKPVIRLKVIEGEAGLFSTKLGGQPYLPPGYDYPCSTKQGDEGQPLHLLAQLNLDELPQLPHWPSSGMLQFFIADDDVFGLDFDNNLSQSGWRVIYHPQIDYSLLHHQLLPAPPQIGEFPFTGEFSLEAELSEMPMSSSDFRFEELFNPCLQRSFADNACSYGKLPYLWSRLVHLRCSGCGSHIGGYAAFTQEDPRTVSHDEYTSLLLQLDSDSRHGISWGDGGVANFFITPDQLEQGDFTRVMYNWDCY